MTTDGADSWHPLSLSQREVWLDQLAWPNSTHLNIGGAGYLIGEIDLPCLQNALDMLIAEHEALRLVPTLEGRQRLLEAHHAALEVIDLTAEPDSMAAMLDWERAWIRVPFILGETPPWRIALLQGKAKMNAVVIQFHHLVMDGWSTAIFIQRLSELYNALLEGCAPGELKSPGYRQYIQDSNSYRISSVFEKDESFWREQLSALPEPMFERRYPVGARQVLPDAHIRTETIRRDFYRRLETAATASSSTTYHWVLAAVAIYLGLSLNRSEIVIGVPCLNRSGKRYKSTLGMFVGVLPLVVTIDRNAPVQDLIAAVTAKLRAVYRHPSYPLSEHARVLNLVQQGRDSLFDVLVSYERQDYACNFGAAKSHGAHQTFSGKARYALGITLCEFLADEDVELVLEASSANFSGEEVALIGRRLGNMLSIMNEDAGRPLGEIAVMPPDERWRVLNMQHKTATPIEDPVPFISQFEHQARLFPEALALRWEGGRMSYRELNARSSRLCRRLRLMLGTARPQVVALAVERGPEMVIALLAIAKSGAAFLPVDTEAPLARVADIIEQSQSSALLVNVRLCERYASLAIPLLPFDLGSTADTAGDADDAPGVQPNLTDIAYVIFTSGSTGRPKGVQVGQDALARRVAWIAKSWDITARDCFAQATQITFDPALIELVVPLTQGACVALPPAGRLLPESLAGFAIQHGVTVMAFVPTTLQRFLDGLAGQPGLKLRVACSGGEVLQPELAKRFSVETSGKLYNVYGPTEATIFATAWDCQVPSETRALPVGRALDDTRIYILDAGFNVLPFGIAGEVYIAGRTLAKGYLNRPELDEEAFIPDPYRPGERMYRTGDRGWLDVFGYLHFLGREDRQVKLRGYRIELGEIEAVIQSLPGVIQAAVKMVSYEGRQAIHAWVVSDSSGTEASLRKELSMRLPDYMVPARFSLLPELPETQTRKVDYNALPAIAAKSADKRVRAPSGETERTLLKIWSETLHRPALTVYDNFFESGGDSLTAVSLMAAIEQRFSVKLGLHQLIENQTVADMADALNHELGLPSLMVSLGTTSRNATMYLAASGHGDLLRFQTLAKSMEGACDLRMLQPPGIDEDLDIRQLAALYADRIEIDGDRDIYVAGFSVGGLAALETARILESRGIRVKELFLVDTILFRLPPGGLLLWRMLAWLAQRTPIFDFSLNGRRFAATLNDSGLYSQVLAMKTLWVEPYQGAALLIKSSGLTVWDRWLFKPWRKLIRPRLIEQTIQGLHGSMFKPGQIEDLAKILASRM